LGLGKAIGVLANPMAERVGRPEIIQEAVVRAFEYLVHEIVSVRRRDEIAALGAVVADGVRGIFVSE